MVDKLVEYAAIGPAEYWCVDPIAGTVLVFTRAGDEPCVVRRGQTQASTLLDGFAGPLDRGLPPPHAV